jgi:hypothetical protein
MNMMNLQENIHRIKEMMRVPYTKDKKVEPKKVICKCGWKWDFKDGGDDPYVCHKCGHDNSENTNG